ncbi:MAG: antibiotic biosynthesis monooxygenase [Burkholderiales bacterium]|nr:antibiotic biosynthesis monooxygenase [Burkholderiales bacterium]
MLALFFEVCPRPGMMQRYLDIAASMRPQLDSSGGCLFIDRFKSLEREGWLLSYQIWRDEAAMTAWRVHAGHHGAQKAGRDEVFADYRLRVAQVLREEAPGKPAWEAKRLSIWNDPAHTKPRYLVVADSQSGSASLGAARVESFESIYRPGRFAHLASVASYAEALDLTEVCRVGGPVETFRVCETERDYGMFERREAPQYFSEARR